MRPVGSPSSLIRPSVGYIENIVFGKSRTETLCNSFVQCPRASLVQCPPSAFAIRIGSFDHWNSRPTQSIMYVPLYKNRYLYNILLIFKYKYLKSYSGDFMLRIWSSAQDHDMMILLVNTVEFLISYRPLLLSNVCTTVVSVSKGASEGASP